ncbi:hypothetical protein V1277_002848 [Bradyrhizobium sp. AZCC 1588]
MITLRVWPVRRRLRMARYLPARFGPRDCAGAPRLPRFRLALAWRHSHPEPPAPAESESTRILQVDNRLQVVLAWSAQLYFLLERAVQAAPRHAPALRILTRLGPVLTLRSARQRASELDRRPDAYRTALRLLSAAQENRPPSARRAVVRAGRVFPPRLFRLGLAPHSGPATAPQRMPLAWPLQRYVSRRGAALDADVAFPAASRLVSTRRAATNVPRLFAFALTDDVRAARPEHRVFRHIPEPSRPVAAPRRADIVWRKPPAGGGARTDDTISYGLRRAMPAAASPSRAAPAPVAPPSAATSAPRLSAASAIQIDPATMNRLTHEVIGRIEQKLRVERERRGG